MTCSRVQRLSQKIEMFFGWWHQQSHNFAERKMSITQKSKKDTKVVLRLKRIVLKLGEKIFSR